MGLSLRPGPAAPSIGLSLRPGPSTPSIGLSLRPAAGVGDDRAGDAAAAPARMRGLSFQTAPPPPDELDELDLPIADDWDELDPSEIPPPAPRGPVPTYARPFALQTPQGPDPGPTPPPPVARAVLIHPGVLRSYSERLELVLDPRTPLPLAMSQLHRLRVPDLRRVAAARRLTPALVTAARRRVGSR
ncbi:MAG: hypothetical protein H0T76_11980 [Nannocystis sp.]|nr:hypothetical protein [Nannocystis sp.]MBA3547196.1 hypothetical protein [Nannocystis sp.]